MHILSKKNKYIRTSLLGITLLSFFGCSSLSSKGNEETNNQYNNNLVLGQGSVAKFEKELNSISGLNGSFSFSLSFPDKNETSSSSIKLDNANLLFLNSSKGGISDFHLDGRMIYNDANLPFLIHQQEEDTYVSLMGARYRYSHYEFDNLFDELISIFGTDIVTVPDSFYQSLDKIFSSFNSSNDTSNSDFSGTFASENSLNNEYRFSLTLDSLGSKIYFLTDTSYNLKRAYAESLKIDKAIISFNFAVADTSNLRNKLSELKPTDTSSYTSIVNSLGLVRKFAELSANPKAGLTFSSSIKNKTGAFSKKEEGIEEDLAFNGSIDFDKNSSAFHGNLTLEGEGLKGEKGSKNIAFRGSQTTDSWKAYLNYNNIFKVSCDSLTFDNTLALFEEEAGVNGVLSSFTSFLSSNPLMKDVKEGRYDKIISTIGKINTSDNEIVLSLNLAFAGFGDNSNAEITISANNKNLIDAAFFNCEIGSLTVYTFSLKLRDYIAPLNDLNESEYAKMDGLPSIASQMKNLFQNKRAAFSIAGSAVDSNGVGYPSINGNFAFDLGAGKGALDIHLVNKNKKGTSKDNHVVLEVTGKEDTDLTRFHYTDGGDEEKKPTDNKGMRGEMSINDLNSLISLVTSLFNEEDSRFQKFFEPLKMALVSNAVGALLSNRFGPLISTNVLKQANLNANNWCFVIDSASFGLGGESFNVDVTFLGEGANKTISSLHIYNLKSGEKTIDITLNLLNYGEAVPESSFSLLSSFYDHKYFKFDGIDVLVKCLLNESKRETYNLVHGGDSFNIRLKMLSGIFDYEFKLKLDFKIYVKGEVVKVFGSVQGIDWVEVVGKYHKTFNYYSTGKKSITRGALIYYDNVDTSVLDKEVALRDQKGHLYIEGYNEYYTGSGSKKVFHHDLDCENSMEKNGFPKYSTDQLADTKIVLHMLLWDILGLNLESYIDDMVADKKNIMASESILTTYQYTNDSNPSWLLGIDLGALAGSSILKNIPITLNGTLDNYLSSLSIPKTKFIYKAALIEGEIGGTIINNPPTKNYWEGEANNNWNEFMKTHRGLSLSTYTPK